MHATLFLRAAAALVSTSSFSCQTGDAIAPPGSELIPVATANRPALPGEFLPVAQAAGGASAIQFVVKREGFCMYVEATLSREPHDLAVIGRVYVEPADCATSARRSVIEYRGTIRDLTPGDYQVRIFDADGAGTPHLIESTFVKVSL
ncbi:MAG TPA: hypothetical protein VIH53_10905 [Gemmatimonadaceae bacterium]|jgi:hypothetical protein